MTRTLILTTDEAIELMGNGIDAIIGGNTASYMVGEIYLNEDGSKTYLERCVGHSPDNQTFYFKDLAVYDTHTA